MNATEQNPDGGESSPINCLETIARRSLDDGASCGMMLHKFAARSVDQVSALERALGAGNARELAREAHTLKRVAADLAADALRVRADDLERSAERGDLEEAGLALARTREEIERCVEAAGALLAQLLDEPSNHIAT
ncbi:MAG: Hpt domain-containing protein [Pirellulales bacterium]